MTPEQIEEARAIYKKYGRNKNSYAGAYSNIVKLEKYIETDSPSPEKLLLKSYIEGIGTVDNESDKGLASALGLGRSGVKEKVKTSLREVVGKIRKNHWATETVISKLTINLFGFSRGAAAARHFIHAAKLTNTEGGGTVAEQLEALGYQVCEVNVGFVGLFDTVASHGIFFDDDTAALNLNAITHAADVVHLTSADEHRKNFSLTNIRSAGGKGQEIFLPGVHSDIGGSYRDGPGEKQLIFWKKNIFSAGKQAEAEKTRLVAANWYKAEELTPIRIALDTVVLEAKRDTISNRYSQIPLHIMAQLAKESDCKESSIVFKDKLERSEEIHSDLERANKEIQAYVNQHKGARSSRPEDWHDNQWDWLRELRYSHFHFSAKFSVIISPHAPRYIDGKRQRMTHPG
ncbi:MAG: DUF2235 domain-containing protein [Gammaproteobacteria bacterium]|nr:DUF2235 domain-containing protein [Gammaproteobacteria bacterium]